MLKTTESVGTPSTGVTAVEYGHKFDHWTELTVSNVADTWAASGETACPIAGTVRVNWQWFA